MELTLGDFQHTEGTKDYTLTIDKVPLGQYTVTETKKDVDGKTVTVTNKVDSADEQSGETAGAGVKAGGKAVVHFTNEYHSKAEPKKFDVKFKNIIETGALLPTARIRIVNKKTGKVVTEWQSKDTDDGITTVSLEPGTYVMQEENPDTKLFNDSENIEFTVDENGLVTLSDGTTADTIVMVNKLKPTDQETQETSSSKTNPGSSTSSESEDKDSGSDKTSKKATPSPTKKSSSSTSSSTVTRTTSGGTTRTTTTRTNSVKTGDMANAALPTSLGGIALLVIVYLLLEEKKRKRM